MPVYRGDPAPSFEPAATIAVNSVEKFHERAVPAQKTLLGAGIFIIESLSKELKQFAGKRIFFLALPLKLKSGDGALRRALAVPIER